MQKYAETANASKIKLLDLRESVDSSSSSVRSTFRMQPNNATRWLEALPERKQILQHCETLQETNTKESSGPARLKWKTKIWPNYFATIEFVFHAELCFQCCRDSGICRRPSDGLRPGIDASNVQWRPVCTEHTGVVIGLFDGSFWVVACPTPT